MSSSTNLPRDIIAKLFHTLHNPEVYQDWWFLLNPYDKSHFASNNNVICINRLFHISDSGWLKIFPFFSDVLKDVYNFFQKHTLSNMNDDIIDKFLSRLVSREESNSLWNLFQIACFELNIFEEIQITYLHIHFILKKYIEDLSCKYER